jgi:hypothetical protein
MDTTLEAAKVAKKPDSNMMKLKEHSNDLYFLDTNSAALVVHVSNHTLVNTVTGNKQPFVPREIELADKARELYRKLGRPSQQIFEPY